MQYIAYRIYVSLQIAPILNKLHLNRQLIENFASTMDIE